MARFVVFQAGHRERLRHVGAACQGLILAQGLETSSATHCRRCWRASISRWMRRATGRWAEPIELEHTEFAGLEALNSEA
jgi:hypothetical protein